MNTSMDGMHFCTNGLNNNTEAERTAKSVVNVAQVSKSGKCNVSVFSILPRNQKWNGNAIEVNGYLGHMFTARNFYTTYDTNKITVKPTNRSTFHLHKRGTESFSFALRQ